LLSNYASQRPLRRRCDAATIRSVLPASAP